jgi:hypothetical protein
VLALPLRSSACPACGEHQQHCLIMLCLQCLHGWPCFTSVVLIAPPANPAALVLLLYLGQARHISPRANSGGTRSFSNSLVQQELVKEAGSSKCPQHRRAGARQVPPVLRHDGSKAGPSGEAHQLI